MKIDTRVHGGVVHTIGGPAEADILISGERIAAIVDPGYWCDADNTIDAAGSHVLPGLVDLHAHTRVPGYEYKEDYATCSQAAAVGGITSFTDMPNVDPPTDTVELFQQKRAIAEESCIVDWGHLVSPNRLEEIPRLAAAGVTGFKIFQVSGGYPHDPRIAMGDSHRVFSAFQAIARTGLHCSVHPFNQPLMDSLTEEALEAGRPRDMMTFGQIYTTDIVWSSSVSVLLELQRATGVRLNLLHTHAGRSLQLVKQARAEGQTVTAAIDPKYYHLTMADMKMQGARCAPGGFVTADVGRMEMIWECLRDGTISLIDSDHAPHTLEDLKQFEADPWTGPFGSPQYEYLLPLILTDVRSGLLSLEAAIKLLSENPARLIGWYPRKGALQVGSDADLVVVDLDGLVVPSDDHTYSKSHWTPYAGRELYGSVRLTMRRGEVIAEGGVPARNASAGTYLVGRPQ